MWVCLNDGFFSIVRDTSRPDGLLVRCRDGRHLERAFPGRVIEFTPKADYGWRTHLPRSSVANFLQERVLGIDYPNFKASVSDQRLHDLYADFWELHWEYQRGQLRRP